MKLSERVSDFMIDFLRGVDCLRDCHAQGLAESLAQAMGRGFDRPFRVPVARRDFFIISATARSLVASLVFGLRRLVIAKEIPKGFRYANEGVEALARWLVLRMANHRSALLYSSGEARSLKDKRRILDKLAGGGLDTRSIYHPLHLDAEVCRMRLAELETDQLVMRNGRLWERIEGRNMPGSPGEHLQLDV